MKRSAIAGVEASAVPLRRDRVIEVLAVTRRSVLQVGASLLLTATSGQAEERDTLAKRPATIEWAAAETIVALGGLPIATASPFNGQVGITSAFPGVPQIGSIFSPNLENLQALMPDLIFCASWQQNLLPMLRRIAPVHVFDLRNPSDSVVDNTFHLLKEVGRLIGREDEAHIYQEQAAREFEELEAGLLSKRAQPVLIGALVPDGRHISVFGRGSLFDGVLRRLGLTNAWTGPMNVWGNITQGIEVLADYPDALFVVLDTGAPTIAAKYLLRESSLWNALPLARSGNLRPIPFAWLYGGLPTALGFARSLSSTLI